MPLARQLLMATRRCSPITLVGSVSAKCLGVTYLSLAGLGLQEGDFVFAWYLADAFDQGGRISTPTGWTNAISQTIATNNNTFAIYKRMTSTPDTAVSLSPSGSYGVMMAVAFRGVRSASPIIDLGVQGDTLDPPSLSAGNNPCAVSLAVALGNQSGSLADITGPPEGWTWLREQISTSGQDHFTAAAYKLSVNGTVDPAAFPAVDPGVGSNATFHVLIAGNLM